MTACSRRDALAAAAAAGLLAAAMPAWRFATGGLFFYDARFDTASLARAAAKRAGSTIIALDGDFGNFVHRLDSDSFWGTAGIAGLTTPAVTFIVEQLALRRGISIVHHAPYLWSTAVGRSVGSDILRTLEKPGTRRLG